MLDDIIDLRFDVVVVVVVDSVVAIRMEEKYIRKCGRRKCKSQWDQSYRSTTTWLISLMLYSDWDIVDFASEMIFMQGAISFALCWIKCNGLLVTVFRFATNFWIFQFRFCHNFDQQQTNSQKTMF